MILLTPPRRIGEPHNTSTSTCIAYTRRANIVEYCHLKGYLKTLTVGSPRHTAFVRYLAEARTKALLLKTQVLSNEMYRLCGTWFQKYDW